MSEFTRYLLLSLLLGAMCHGLKAQELAVFQQVEQQCPSLPKGLLQAVSYTNTQCHHLTDADYHAPAEDASAMPRAYGMMGLVLDGKGYFRENLKTVSERSGFPVEAIVEDPTTNVLAYAKALESVAEDLNVRSNKVEDFMPAIMALSELPSGEAKNALPMKLMLYSVYDQLDVDLESLFGSDYDLLSGQSLRVSKETDYPGALWVPAPPCNFEERTKEVSAVVIHYTEGSYAGAISWFLNCDSSVSAHYVIRSSDGQITQMVREADKAWHARTANGYTIGIEHEAYGDILSFFTEAMYHASADLVRNICSRYETIDGHRTFYRDTLDNGTTLNTGVHPQGGEEGCVKIRGHQHYPDQTHTDPGPFWNWNYYYKLINEGTFSQVFGGPGITQGDLDHENYGDDERRIWVIRSVENSVITLDFSSFDLEADYDFLWIYDGEDVYAPKLGRWNTTSPGSVRSTGNAMCVEFRSDCATTAGGWRAHWTVETPAHVDTVTLSPEECFDIFPNPVGEVLNLRFSEQGFHDVEIHDSLGRRLFKARLLDNGSVDVSQWERGVYSVRYKRVKDGQTKVLRFIR